MPDRPLPPLPEDAKREVVEAICKANGWSTGHHTKQARAIVSAEAALRVLADSHPEYLLALALDEDQMKAILRLGRGQNTYSTLAEAEQIAYLAAEDKIVAARKALSAALAVSKESQ